MNMRPAVISDLPYWAEMRTALWPDSAEDNPRELSDFFAGESVDIVEAIMLEADDGVLAGFLELNLRNFAEGSRSSSVPYVEAWYVRPEYQGKGYGRALMERAEHWALEKGYAELASDTELENHRSIGLHRHLGFEETDRVVCFLKRLDKPGRET